jgi:hypothetical protein
MGTQNVEGNLNLARYSFWQFIISCSIMMPVNLFPSNLLWGTNGFWCENTLINATNVACETEKQEGEQG